MTPDIVPALSVVVPAYEAQGTIGACLDALAAQSDAPPFEVVVVDSSPDGATVACVAERARRHPSLALRCEHLAARAFPGVARNAGVRLARADLLLFVDSDCVPASDLVAAAVNQGIRAAQQMMADEMGKLTGGLGLGGLGFKIPGLG